MTRAFVIELASSGFGPLYLRDHFDGARSWTRNPEHATRFVDREAAEWHARRHLSSEATTIAEVR